MDRVEGGGLIDVSSLIFIIINILLLSFILTHFISFGQEAYLGYYPD